LSDEHWAALEEAAQGLEVIRYSSAVRVLRPGWKPPGLDGRVALITAGSSDVPVADEARMLVEACGHDARLECDVGVAGLHRLLAPLAELVAWKADVVVVCAGMDGVLPGVVAGLVDAPVIGVPVSTGYGAGGRGQAALLTMLQSCSTGLTLVNIDNGVGAGAAAVLIASRVAAARRGERARRSRRAGAR
jgi:NCAIR mutase (PurE)-related protein